MERQRFLEFWVVLLFCTFTLLPSAHACVGDQPDGIRQPGEQCDDGNNVCGEDEDGCDPNCKRPGCGNGFACAATGEACDDGTAYCLDTHGPCSRDSDCPGSTCIVADCVGSPNFGEPCATDSDCPGGVCRPYNRDDLPDFCRSDCSPAACGDGVVDSGEACDDGNTADGDACSAACQPCPTDISAEQVSSRRDNTYSVECAQEAPCGDPLSGACDECVAGCGPIPDEGIDTSMSTSEVLPQSGEFRLTAVDLEIPGRGFPFRWERTYKSQIQYDGPLGFNWEFNYNTRLVRAGSGGGIHQFSGYARVNTYTLQGGELRSPGYFTDLGENPDGTYTLRNRDGTEALYDGFTGGPTDGALLQMRDRDGNTMRFLYDAGGRLTEIRDTLDRKIVLKYDRSGRIVELRDFGRRKVKYSYDEDGNLVSVTSPKVSGTPNRNNFVKGKTKRYSYSRGFADPALNHNLLSITRPNEVAAGGPPALELTYGTDPASALTFDRVITQALGGQSQASAARGLPAAGGQLTYFYAALSACSNPSDLATACVRTTIVDRNGNVSAYDYNRNQNLVRKEEFTGRVDPSSPTLPPTGKLRPTDPASFVTTYAYNGDSLLTRVTSPEGNRVDYAYDAGSADRRQQGNLLQERRTPDAARGGDQTELVTTYTYEPIYNQVRSVCEPRGNDASFAAPVDPGARGCGRYTTAYTFDYEEGCDFAAIGANTGRAAAEVQELLEAAGMCAAALGDVNGDGGTAEVQGEVVRTRHPSVHLIAGSNQAALEGDAEQEIVELFAYNEFGQPVRRVDPEGNVDEYLYHPARDPDGDGKQVSKNTALSASTGGYLKQATRDSTAGPDRNSGTNPPPTEIRRLYFYDKVGNVIREVDGRGIETQYRVNALNQVVQITRASGVKGLAPDPPEPLALKNFKYLERIAYDANDNVVGRQIEDRDDTSNTGGFVDHAFAYDILDDLIETRSEVSSSESLVTGYRYDANQNRTQVIEPGGNFHSTEYDERDLVFRETRGAGGPFGGTPATTTTHYDRNRNRIESVDAADTDGSGANNSSRGGAGDRTRYVYDGFDRLTSIVDSVGNQTVYQYDPAGNQIRVARFGPTGGTSPTSDGPSTLSMPVSSAGVIQSGKLVSTSLLEATETLHDERNRAFQVNRALFVNTIQTVRAADVADGATDIGKGDLTPGDTCAVPGVPPPPSGHLGCVSTRTEYDRSSRATFTVEDDGDTYERSYDGADRVIKTVDPEGNVVERAYDDNDNVIEVKETDVAQVAGIGDEIFLTTNFYDSLDRLEKTVDNLGQTLDYRYDSRNNLVAMADAQGPPGPAITRRAFDEGALTVNTTNRFGNVTVYSYDGLSRKTREDRVLTASGEGDGVNIGATVTGKKAELPTPDPAQSADGLITIRYEWDENSRLLHAIDDNGNQTEYGYDNLNRRVTETKGICVPPQLADRCDPPTTMTAEYDPDDNLVRLTDENGSVTNCHFDALNRRAGCAVTRAAGVVGTTAISYQYDGLSRSTRLTDNNEPATSSDDSVVSRAYDSLGRMVEETQKIGGSGAKPVSSAWRSADLRTNLTYPNGRILRYTYDGLDRLDTVGDSAEPEVIADYDHIGAGRVLERSHPQNGTRITYLDDSATADVGYDGLRRRVQLRHLAAGNSLIVGFTHAYDRMNNKLDEQKLHDPANSESYAYDSAYRLISFERLDPAAQTPLHSSWVLDGVGNWRQVDNETRRHSSFNEITERDGVPVLSDDNGNETDDGTFTFQWDYRNRLHTVTRKSDGLLIARYSYDAVGRRIRKVVTNSATLDGTTDFYLDGWREIEGHTATSVQQYVYGRWIDEPLTLHWDDQTFFYHQDAKTHVAALSDSAGSAVEQLTYEAYGQSSPLKRPENPYLFTGRRFDAEAGLYYFRSRYQDPATGRFVQRDPLGEYANPTNLVGNTYTYVSNNPPNTLDPLGLQPFPISLVSVVFGPMFDATPKCCDCYVKVYCGSMSGTLHQSYHCWFEKRGSDCSEHRVEVWKHKSLGVGQQSLGLGQRYGHVYVDALLRGWWEGQAVAPISQLVGSDACQVADCINREAPLYKHKDSYNAVFGPNSNTFVAVIAKQCNLSVVLPRGAVSKDYDERPGGLPAGQFQINELDGSIQISQPLVELRSFSLVFIVHTDLRDPAWTIVGIGLLSWQ